VKKISLVGSILLILFILLSLVACGNSKESSTQLSTTGTSSTTTLSSISTTSTTILSSTSTVESQTTTFTPSTPTAAGKEFIWRVSSPTATVYLLGSVHVANKDIYPLDGSIENAFSQAANIVVEVDTNKVDTNALAALMVKYGTYPPGSGLKKNLPESLYTKLSGQFTKFGINLALLDNYRPWVISTTLEQLIAEGLGYKADSGIDFYFIDEATADGKNILELETAEFQLELLSSFSDELMIQYLQEDLENTPTTEDFEELFSAWEEGDLAKMESLVFEPLVQKPELADYYEKVFNERNINMAKKISDFLSGNETYFVVVGAGHMVGDQGLINIMKEKRYTVAQLEDMD
jgi:uncharacterized protein YbaP (TraB family)